MKIIIFCLLLLLLNATKLTAHFIFEKKKFEKILTKFHLFNLV